MAIKQINIVQKYSSSPLEIVTRQGSIATPVIIQPEWLMDVSVLFGIFIPSASTGIGLVWNPYTTLLDISCGTVGPLDPCTFWITGAQHADLIQFNQGVNAWTNVAPRDITDFFYTKDEIDYKFFILGGGSY